MISGEAVPGSPAAMVVDGSAVLPRGVALSPPWPRQLAENLLISWVLDLTYELVFVYDGPIAPREPVGGGSLLIWQAAGPSTVGSRGVR